MVLRTIRAWQRRFGIDQTGPQPHEYRCRTLESRIPLASRQEMIKGWDQQRVESTTLLVAGCGGLGGEIVDGAANKGYGMIHMADHDTVEPSNLHRQRFTADQCYENKANALAKLISQQAALGSVLISHPVVIQEVDLDQTQPDVIVCGVDDQFETTRLDLCRSAYARRIPAVFMAATRDADGGYVFIQTSKPGDACWACFDRPEDPRPRGSSAKCPGTPASIDILKALAGPALYAIDSLVMARACEWNHRYISLRSVALGGSSVIQPRSDCIVCGSECMSTAGL